MTVHHTDDLVTVHHGDCLDVLRELPDASVDAVVTDPPYSLSFMGKSWDADHVDPAVWVQCLRVLKPGGHLLAFGGTRTWHRLACAIEDAGFEIRDSIAWLYGSGFPKSLDVSKAIDKKDGRFGWNSPNSGQYGGDGKGTAARPGNKRMPNVPPVEPESAAAKQWQGWGTALKPAHEPIVVARKPLAGTVAANVQQWGTGALNIDGCRIGYEGATTKKGQREGTTASVVAYGDGLNGGGPTPIDAGRWPANVTLDTAAANELDRQSGTLTSGANPVRRGSDKFRDAYGDFAGQEECTPARGVDTGGASRFFYVAKAPTDQRPRADSIAHPTVKPLDLMRWLVRLVTPPGGLVLDPFAGSGTTAEACIIEGFRCIAVEREADYLPLIVARLTKPIQPDLFGGVA